MKNGKDFFIVMCMYNPGIAGRDGDGTFGEENETKRDRNI